jgi:Ca-activated chloride channel family protein
VAVLEVISDKFGVKSPYKWVVCGALLLIIAYAIWGGGFALRTADQKGYASYAAGDYTAAQEQFSDPMWRGVSAFEQGGFKKATSVFSGIQSADGFYNHGNSLLMGGKYAEAIESYSRALDLAPHADAEHNKKVAETRLKALTFEGGNMTDGKLKGNTNDVVFDKGKGPQEQADKAVVEGEKMDDVQMREVWLRKVQTKPADFLKSKFRYQKSDELKQGGQSE